MAADAPTAFLVYSREDSEFALRLVRDLKAAGASVWIDQLDIEPGMAWDYSIEDAVNNCSHMLVIMSPASVQSRHVRDEVSFALEERKTLIPVLYRDCDIPLRLSRFQYVDVRNDYARGLDAILAALGRPRVPAVVSAGPGKSISAVSTYEQEQASLEAERRLAAERAKLEEERRQLAAMKQQIEKQERERLAAAEKARSEREERERQAAAEKAQPEQDRKRSDSVKIRPPSQMKQGAVFLSYSRTTDQEAVETLYTKLTQAGIPAWYDAGLKGAAAAWDERIQRFIQICSVFIAVLSESALSRRKGSFRGEWQQAVDGERQYYGTDETAIVPVVVDETGEIFRAPEKFEGMPSRFKQVQMYHCPRGEPGDDLINCLRSRLEKEPD